MRFLGNKLIVVLCILFAIRSDFSFANNLEYKKFNITNSAAFRSPLIDNRSKNISQILYRFSQKGSGQKIKIYLQAGLHGDERTPPEFLFWLMENIKRKEGNLYSWIQNSNRSIEIDFLPIANPSGYALNQRNNYRGVNLNRNFPVLFGESKEYPGAYAASELETKSLMEWIQKQKYSFSIDIHGYADYLVLPSNLKAEQKGYSSKNWSDQTAILRNLYSRLEAILSTTISSYKILSPQEIGHGGSFEDWSFWQANIPAFCLELSKNTTINEFKTYENFLIKVLESKTFEENNPGNLSIFPPNNSWFKTLAH